MKKNRSMCSICLLCLMLLSFSVQAADHFRLEGEITGTQLLEKWDGQTSEEYDWFTINMHLTNWHVDTQNIAELVSGRLVFKEAYEFAAIPVFDTETIGPLSEKDGSLVIEIPKMVSRMFTPEDVKVFVAVDGKEEEIEAQISVSAAGAKRSGTFEGAGYDTPEDSVLAYLEGLNKGDVSEMLSTFAIETYVENAEPADVIRRIRSFQMSMSTDVPITSDYGKSIVISSRYGELARGLQLQYVELSAHTDGMPIQISDESSVQELLDLFEDSPVNEWEGRVEFVEWLDPRTLSPNYYYKSSNRMNIARRTACEGADDWAELAAHIRLNGVDAVQFMECARYDGRWYNMNYMSNLSALMALSSFSAGLAYPGEDTEWDMDSLMMPDGEPETEDEVTEVYSSWEASDLPGTFWKLESVNIPGLPADVGIADGGNDAQEDTGYSMYADIRFMSMGTAVMDCRISPALAESEDTEDTYLKTVFLWYDRGGNPVIEESTGILNGLDLSYAECIRNDDSLVFHIDDEGSLTFRRVQK